MGVPINGAIHAPGSPAIKARPDCQGPSLKLINSQPGPGSLVSRYFQTWLVWPKLFPAKMAFVVSWAVAATAEPRRQDVAKRKTRLRNRGRPDIVYCLSGGHPASFRGPLSWHAV